MILSLIGWPLGLICLAVAVPLAVRTLRHRQQRGDRGNWTAVLIFALGADACFGVAGLLSGLAAIIAGVVLLGVFAAVARPWQKGASRNVAIGAAFGKDWLVKDTRSAWDWLRDRIPLSCGGGEDEAPPVVAAVAEHVATRSIPPVMADPALGPATEPGEIAAAGIPVPAPYAALASYIGGFEPEDDMALRIFMEGHASGSVALADAWHAFADHCLNGAGLSPAYVAGILEAGDSAGEHASLLAQVHKRFHVVYAAVKEWIAAHGPLPHKAREFLTGED